MKTHVSPLMPVLPREMKECIAGTTTTPLHLFLLPIFCEITLG